MIDPILNEIDRLSLTKFVVFDLKRKFFEPYYNKWGVDVPYEQIEEDSFTIEFNNLYNPITEVIESFKATYHFPAFLKKEVKEIFDRFKLAFYDQYKFEPNQDKRQFYATLIFRQLVDDILPKIEANNQIEDEWRNTILEVLNAKIKSFKGTFNISLTSEDDSTTNKIKSFQYNNRLHFEHNLTILLSSLKSGALISNTTTKKRFFKIFKHITISKKVTWTGTQSQFYYFILKINELEDFTDFGHKKWEMASACFLLLDSKGKEIDWRKFRSLKKPNEDAIQKIDHYLNL